MNARTDVAAGAGVLDRLQVLRSAPAPLRGTPVATWTPSPRTAVGQRRVPGTGLQPSLPDTTTTRTDPAGSTVATLDFGPKDGVHLNLCQALYAFLLSWNEHAERGLARWRVPERPRHIYPTVFRGGLPTNCMRLETQDLKNGAGDGDRTRDQRLGKP